MFRSVVGQTFQAIAPGWNNSGIRFSRRGFPTVWTIRDICLLHVSVNHAEYWDSPSGKMVQLAGFIKSVLTGKRLENAGDHEELDLESKDFRI